jgi:HlyD family secretion protein
MSGKLKAVVSFALAAVLLAAIAWASLEMRKAGALLDGVVAANGRLEANQVEIAAKLAGRIIEVVPREGDMIDAGAVVARLDKAEIEAQLRQAEAEAQRARKATAAANAALASRKAEWTFAKQELDRTTTLVGKGFATRQRLDQRRQQMSSASATVEAANAQIEESQAAIRAEEA